MDADTMHRIGLVLEKIHEALYSYPHVDFIQESADGTGVLALRIQFRSRAEGRDAVGT
jgi:hypothetical protein